MKQSDFYPDLNPLTDDDFVKVNQPIVVEDMRYGRLVLAVFLGIILSLIAFGFYISNSPLIEEIYNNGYTQGNLDGLLYTQHSGEVVFSNENNLTSLPLGDVCEEVYLTKSKQEVNQNGKS